MTLLVNIIAAKHELFVANKEGMPSADPVRFYRRLVPRERELQEQAAQAFAKLNDWKVSARGFSLRALAGHEPDEPWSGQQYNRPLFDHCIFFKRHRKPIALVAQPYPDGFFGCIDQASEIADWLGLQLHVPPALKASIHNVGGCVFLVFTKRGERVTWLPEQVSGVDRAGRMQRVRIIGRASPDPEGGGS